MSFFDDKQEILKVELTTYGRFLLSRGKFRPVYYAFYDDDIIYDSLYANLSESQNSIQDRIFNETPSLKPQTTFTSVEDSVKLNKLILREIDKLKEEEAQISSDKNYALSLPLANSSLSSDYSPAWSLSFISGSISSSQPYINNSDGLSGSLQPYLKVPQINLLDNVYDIKMKKNDFSLDNNYRFVTVEVSGSDQYVYSMKDNELILSVLEANVDSSTKNFDIEFFVEEEEKILGRDEKKKILKKLNFKKDPVSIINNILLDNPITFEIEEDENYVEYFFELTIDDEIEIPPQEAVKPAGTGTNTYQSNVKNGPFGVDC